MFIQPPQKSDFLATFFRSSESMQSSTVMEVG